MKSIFSKFPLFRTVVLAAVGVLVAGCAVQVYHDSASAQHPSAGAGRFTGAPIQYVALAFDGSKSLDMWDETMAFARDHDIAFTYFVSGVYFLANENSALYRGPGRKRGRSDIGFGGSVDDVRVRVQKVAQADREGHEIASHANGHFRGDRWSQTSWMLELDQFDNLLRHVHRNNDISDPLPPGWTRIVDQVEGFRAPLLGTSAGLWPALAAHGYRYDTSGVRSANLDPRRKAEGLWDFALAPLRTSAGNTLSMDYNFYVLDSGAKPDPANAQRYEDRMVEAYMDYFEGQYEGARRPIHIGHHFSRWNNGAYWRAMKRFAAQVCGRTDVKCTTYREIRRALEDQSG